MIHNTTFLKLHHYTYFRLIRRSKSFCPRAGVPVGVGVADNGTAPQSGSTLRPILIDEGVPEITVMFILLDYLLIRIIIIKLLLIEINDSLLFSIIIDEGVPSLLIISLLRLVKGDIAPPPPRSIGL